MKSSAPNFLRFVAGFVLASSAAVLAQTATTDPVGFITLNVAASGGTSTEQLSFKGLSLSRPVEYQGSAETVGANTLVDDQATWTENQFNGANGQYYVEVVSINGSTSAAGVGTTYDVTATNAATKTITLAQNLGAGVTAPAVFKVRKYWTIGSVFGAANEAGLGGGAQGEADEILIFNPTGGTFDTYYYRIGGIGGSSWRNASTGALAVDQKIYPDDGLLVRRRQNSPVNVVLMGAVKTGTTSTPVSPGTNYIANVYAASMTLGSSGLYTGNTATGVLAGAQGEADEVLIYDQSTKTYKTYYYRLGGIGGSSWRSSDDGTLATDVAIPVGASVVIRRRAAAGFNWVAPQHPASI